MINLKMMSTTAIYFYYFILGAIEQYIPPAWSIGKWAVITGNDLRLSPIIRRVTVCDSGEFKKKLMEDMD
jgi:hypothetical protein